MSFKKGYKRGWKHGKGRGKERTTNCSYCGKIVPKYKTFSVTRGFRITDPMLRNELGIQNNNFMCSSRMNACPGCARRRHIVRKKKR
jgi:ribosomal protein S26